MSGLIYVFTGQGKGKTSAALGMAVRAGLIDKPVSWIAWYKEDNWDLAEKHLPAKLPKIEMSFKGAGFRITKPEMIKGKIKLASVGKGAKVIDTATEEEHRAAAQSALEFATEKIKSGKYFLIIMDEIINAVSEGLLEEGEVIRALNLRGETHIVMTGRANEKVRMILEYADLVTECKKIKHPYDSGKLAVYGLDF
jgi:cob(I)alamin adenosyltransferase